MTVSKVKHESKVVLDLSKEKLNKSRLKKLLNSLEISCVSTYGNQTLYFDNEVRIGIYNLKLILNDKLTTPSSLKKYGGFNIRLYEIKRSNQIEIDLEKDINFKQNSWVNKNITHKLRTNDLIEIILYCKRLDRLKIFS